MTLKETTIDISSLRRCLWGARWRWRRMRHRAAARTSGGVASGVTLPRVNVYALTSDNAIYVLRPGASQYMRLGRVNTPDGGNLIGIDFRPADNTPTKLYGLTDLGTIYNIDVSSSALRPDHAGEPHDPAVHGRIRQRHGLQPAA